jgi:hypothetical protein
MKKTDLLVGIIALILTLFSWYFPDINLTVKALITGLLFIALFIIVFKEKLSFIVRKFWQEIISLIILIVSFLIIGNVYKDHLILAAIIVLTSISTTILVYQKFSQVKVFKSRSLLCMIPIDGRWTLNHWGGSCATIHSNKMVFTGTKAIIGNDGSHIDFKNLLEYGTTYLIKCTAKSLPDTTGHFQLWCHDNAGAVVHGVELATEFKTPSIKGESFEIIFKPLFNNDLRIHLQYAPGGGTIEAYDVMIYKLN